MLKAAFQYSYINAKVRSLKSALLKAQDYENLAKVSGAKGIAGYLKKTSFGKKFSSIPTSFDGLIHLYYKDLFTIYEKLIKMLSGKRKRLVQHLYQKYEMENLKLILRIICREKSRLGKNWDYLLLPVNGFKNFQANELLQAKDLEEIIDKVRGTWYYEHLENSKYRFDEERETFPLEMALDLGYYSNLWQIVSSLSRTDRIIARQLLGIQYDALNIIWMFRFKDIYNFSPEEILNYSLLHGFYLSSEVRLKLAYAIDCKDMVDNLKGTPYKDLLQDIKDPEKCYVKLLSFELNEARKNWKKFPFQLGTLLDYLLFKEIEVKNLISLTEAKKLNLSQEELKDYFCSFSFKQSSVNI